VELQKVAPELDRRGIGIVGVSYDAPDVLRDFASAKGIGFPLLADVGSRVITELGLLDRDVEAHHTEFGIPTQEHQHGVAYPAVFVLDEAGRVVDKRIRESYRVREGSLALVGAALGVTLPPAGSPRAVTENHVAVEVVADADHYVRWQEMRLHVRFDVEPGWHVYGSPIPTGYTPITVEVDSVSDVVVGRAEAPPNRPFRIQGLDEEFQVHEGRFEVLVPIAVRAAAGTGRVELGVAVRYQACSDAECLPPRSLRIDLTLDEAALA
jgi:hypothetical protein